MISRRSRSPAALLREGRDPCVGHGYRKYVKRAWKMTDTDMQRYFRVSPPSVHNMIVTLEKRGFIKRTPGAARSIQLLLRRDQLPDLQ
jgi:hypothetical protein